MVNRQGVEQMSFFVRREHRFPGELPRLQIEGEQSRASVVGFFVSHHVGNRGCRRVEKPSRLVDSQRVAGQEAVLTRMNEIGYLPARSAPKNFALPYAGDEHISGLWVAHNPCCQEFRVRQCESNLLRMSGLRSAAKRVSNAFHSGELRALARSGSVSAPKSSLSSRSLSRNCMASAGWPFSASPQATLYMYCGFSGSSACACCPSRRNAAKSFAW